MSEIYQIGWSLIRKRFRSSNCLFISIIAALAIVSPANAIACKNLSNEEFINRAIEEVLSFDAFRIIGYSRMNPKPGERYVPYRSAAELRSANPNCCSLSSLGRDGFDLGWFTKMFNDFETFIILDFDVKIQVGDEIQMRPVNGSMVALSSCGIRIDME